MLDSKIAHKVIDHALAKGAQFAELFIERNQVGNINLLSDQVQPIQSGIDFGIGVRMMFGNKVLYGYTNSADAEELQRIVTELSVRDRRDPVTTSKSFDFTQPEQAHKAVLPLSKDFAVDEKVKFLLSASKAAKALSNHISQTTSSCSQREQHIEIFNSEGLHTADTRHYISVRIGAVATDGTEQNSGSKQEGGLLGWELGETLDAKEFGEKASQQAIINLNAKPCPSGKMPVVLGNGFGGVIFHEACGHLLETTSVAKKASVFHDKMGEMIANPVVNAVDEGHSQNANGSINIDDEGMETQHTQLIKDGKLTSFLVDRMGAQQTGFERTGSGRRQSYRFAPASRMRNTYIEAGTDSFDDMIASIDKGIYAAHLGGGSVSPGTGEFNFAVTEGYLIEEGKITHAVKAPTLISTGPEVLKEISMVGSDMKLAAGMCGSVSGSVPTTVGQPALKVDDILVGGNA